MIQTGFIYNDFISNLKLLFENNLTVDLKWREGDAEHTSTYTFGLQGISEVDMLVIPQYPYLCIEFEGATDNQAGVPYQQKDVTLRATIHYYAEEVENETNVMNIQQALWAIVAVLRRNNTLGGFCRELSITEITPGFRLKGNGWIQGGMVKVEAIKRTEVF
ncbi:MAG: hypothetical protein WC623_24185 [Pedobacter sp.]|uniref:hypothetical protein n=1 Tax=Pedobacter sp. TaxID=1411316 RepID=UPI00356617C5